MWFTTRSPRPPGPRRPGPALRATRVNLVSDLKGEATLPSRTPLDAARWPGDPADGGDPRTPRRRGPADAKHPPCAARRPRLPHRGSRRPFDRAQPDRVRRGARLAGVPPRRRAGRRHPRGLFGVARGAPAARDQLQPEHRVRRRPSHAGGSRHANRRDLGGRQVLLDARHPLLRGRNFTTAETPASAKVAIVSEAFVRRYWPGEDGLGRRFRTRSIDGT